MGTADTVLEVADGSVRVVPGNGPAGDGGRHAPPMLVDAALEWIDDPVGLLDERPVAVADLWRSLMMTLLGERCDDVLIVYPPDWPRHRIDRVVAAANAVADHVEAVSRDRWCRDGVSPAHVPLEHIGAGRPRRWASVPVTALLVAAGVIAAAGVAFALRTTPAPRAAGNAVVEGRMAVHIPPHWTVQRVTGGLGSRRLQVSPPQGPDIALHLTSSYAPEATLGQAAEVLRRAIADEPAGVFVDLRTGVEVAGRPAVTYREVRPGRVIVWSVIQAGATRISIGCQSRTGREADVRSVCDEAVRTAGEH